MYSYSGNSTFKAIPQPSAVKSAFPLLVVIITIIRIAACASRRYIPPSVNYRMQQTSFFFFLISEAYSYTTSE